MNETTENFLKALRDYEPPQTIPTVWKMAYDSNGKPIYKTAGQPNPGDTWIEISAEQAEQHIDSNPRIRVHNGKVVSILLPCDMRNQIGARTRIRRDPEGKYETDPYNMMIIGKGVKWSV